MAEKEVVDSLKQISVNLDAINKTLTDNKQKEETAVASNEENWRTRIEPLVEKVEHECKRKPFTNKKLVMFFAIILFYFFVGAALVYQLISVLSAIGSYAQILQTDETRLQYLAEQLTTFSALSVSVIAIEVSIVPVVLAFPRTTKADFANWYYNGDWIHQGLSKNMSERDRPYLKALINMKCKEYDVNLSHLFHTYPELFEEKTLLRRLYE
jgi:hypothetical protein